MLKDFHDAMDIFLKRKQYTLKEKTEYTYEITDSFMKQNVSFEYLPELSKKVSIGDERVIAMKKVIKGMREEDVIFRSYSASYPFEDKFIEVKIRINDAKGLLEVSSGILGEDRFWQRTLLGALEDAENEKVNQIKKILLDEVINQKEFRLPYLTGNLKLKELLK